MTAYGYARVSTSGQSVGMQVDALEKAGCVSIFKDTASGAKSSRPGLDDMLAVLVPGDTVTVWKLDRLGRSTVHLFSLMETLKAKGVGVRSLMEGIDTAGSMGRFLFTILAGVAELERENIRNRVQAGIEKAQRDGVKLGRRAMFSTDQKKTMLRLHEMGDSYLKISRNFKCAKSVAWRCVNEAKAMQKAGAIASGQLDLEDY